MRCNKLAIAIGAVASMCPTALSAEPLRTSLGQEVIEDFVARLEQFSEFRKDKYSNHLAKLPRPNDIIAATVVRGVKKGTATRSEATKEFKKECLSKQGKIASTGSHSHNETVKSMFGERSFANFDESNGFISRLELTICLISDEVPAGMLVASQYLWSVHTTLVVYRPSAVVSEAEGLQIWQRRKDEEAIRMTDIQARYAAWLKWQKNVGEGEMTGCGRILVSKPDIVQIADRRTGDARWIERRDLRQPSEGCPW